MKMVEWKWRALDEFGRQFEVYWGFPGGSEVKTSVYNAGDLGSIPGSGRSPGEGNSNSIVFQIFWCFQFFTYKYCSGNIWKKKKEAIFVCAPSGSLSHQSFLFQRWPKCYIYIYVWNLNWQTASSKNSTDSHLTIMEIYITSGLL